MLPLCLTKGLNLLFLSVKCNGSMWDIYSVIIWYIHMVHSSDEVGLVLPRKILLRCAAQKTCAWGLEDSSWQKRGDMLRELMLSNSGYNKITLNHRMSPQLLPSIKTFFFLNHISFSDSKTHAKSALFYIYLSSDMNLCLLIYSPFCVN